jgi:hypothetical protein
VYDVLFIHDVNYQREKTQSIIGIIDLYDYNPIKISSSFLLGNYSWHHDGGAYTNISKKGESLNGLLL